MANQGGVVYSLEENLLHAITMKPYLSHSGKCKYALKLQGEARSQEQLHSREM